ncbi:MAG: RagB/SusD family nutrient uptake outer membrane protein [Capnocytophaga sp.]|nr:RagB/SusD family nutrient uptake outer membrane protein [Capnocytophaga sp.]
MKFHIKSLALLPLFFASCDKYVDITPKGSLLIDTAEELYELVSMPNRGYPINNIQYLSDDQWIRESYVIGVTPNINTAHFTFDTNADRVNMLTSSTFYNRAYVYINRWNTVISLIDDSKGSNETKALAKAEAKIYRAFDHFLLVNVYAKAYDPLTAATDGGICIMDKYDLEAQPSKSTVQQVYGFIQKDIDEAIPYLQEQPIDVYHPSLAFAWAFKARVHLFKREYGLAKEAALKSLGYKNELTDLVALKAQGGPTVVNMPAEANTEVLSYMYMTGYNEMNFGYSYIISPELVQLFEADDTRFNMFFNTTSTSLLDQGSGTAYYNMNYRRFFYPTVGMKTPEVYLILAECYARENNIAEAASVLNTLRKKRIEGSGAEIATPATSKEMMDIIISERRKELMFGFHRFFDLKRFNLEPEYAKTIVRTFPLVNTAVPQQTYTLPPDSYLYILPFAQDVLRLNPSLTLNTDEVIPFNR